MAGYLGHKPTISNYTVDEFTTSSAQASSGNFTLSQTVTNSKTLEISVGGIDQPQSAYSVTGTTLAFGANIIAQNAIVIARHAGESISYPSLETGAVTTAKIGTDAVDGTKIADNAINSEHYTTGSIDTAHIANDQITLAKMAGGTDGQIITYDASGDPVAVGPGTSGQVLTSAGANAPPTFAAAAGGGVDGITSAANSTAISIDSTERVTMPLQPSFLAYVTSTQSNVSGNSVYYNLTGAIWTEIMDIGGNLANGTFTAPVTGTYIFYANIALGSLSTSQTILYGHVQTSNRNHRTYYQGFGYDEHSHTTLTMNYVVIADMDAADTAYLKFKAAGGSQTVGLSGGSQSQQTNFGGFLLG